ncbi:MAG: PQQ-like beta-propeller repeat protein [Opitutales bacterium]|nr:PQQ-like beta-propeller repeat protein [Opitutales bacterium]
MRSVLPPAVSLALTGLLLSPPAVAQPATLEPLWSYDASGVIYSTPAVDSSGNLYFGGHDTRLHSLTAAGELRWTFDKPTDWVESSPALTLSNLAVFGSWDGNIYAVHASTGQPAWTYPTGGYIIGSPAIAPDGTLLIGSADGFLYALSDEGFLRWIYTTDSGEFESSPAIAADGTIYIADTAGTLHAIDPSGLPLWTYSAGAGIYSSPTLAADGTLYVGSEDGHLHAVHPDGYRLWKFRADEGIDSSAVIADDGRIFVASRDGYLYALDAQGIEQWDLFVGDVFYSSPALDDTNTLYIMGYVGNGWSRLVQVDAGGEVLAEAFIAAFNDASPVLANGTLYLGMFDGRLYAFPGSDPAGAWPLFRHNTLNTGWPGGLYPDPDLRYAFWPYEREADGWFNVGWWGSGAFVGTAFPWTFHPDHGWGYVFAPEVSIRGAGGLWYFDLSGGLGWLWMSPVHPNTYFNASLPKWFYHVPGSSVFSPGGRHLLPLD